MSKLNTTSYNLSLKLKQLGVEQEITEFGVSKRADFYWVKQWGKSEPICLHRSQIQGNVIEAILCRAFTLGEIVRELGDSQIAITRLLNFNSVTITSLHEPLTGISEISPEEAAGELLCTIKEQKQN